MLPTPDEEDLPLRHRPLPSVDIALLPHELRALRMQRLLIGGAIALAVLLGFALLFGPAVFARLRAPDESVAAASADAQLAAAQLEGAAETGPIDLNGRGGVRGLAAAARASLPRKGETLLPGSRSRIQHRFGRARSWRDAVVAGGATGAEADEIVAALGELVDFRRGKPDDVMIFEREADRSLSSFEYRASVTDIYRVTRGSDGELRGLKVTVPIETRRVAKGTFIAGTLGHSLSQLGLGSQIASSVIEALDTRVAFTRDTRAGDGVKLIVNEEYVDGNLLRYGPVQAVEYSGERAGKLQAFWFEPSARNGEYFDPSGRAVHGGWLKTPLRYDHVSSPFNLKRRHPILKRIVPHLGIDYAASTGTPIGAAADGVVTFAGPRGANGNLVSLRHSNGFESHYAHLWRIAPGIRKGTTVKQRQALGQVGSTGRSTGPHLHFALKRGGKFVDPASQLNGPGDMLGPDDLPRFKAEVQRLRAELETIAVAPAPAVDSLPPADETADDEDLDL